jgi:pimeloyl-ACP methyl ester carboxylesterase
VDALGLTKIDLLGFSLGGMLAQEMASDRPTLVRRIILAGTGPEGGEDMGMDKPRLMQIFTDQKIPGPEKLVKLFFAPSETSQSAGWAFLQRLGQRTEDRELVCSMETMQAQAAAIGAWGQSRGERFARLRQIKQPALVFNGNDDIMIPTRNSFLLSQHLPNALLIIYPDSGHGALFQYAVSFTRHATEFLDSEAGIPGI